MTVTDDRKNWTWVQQVYLEFVRVGFSTEEMVALEMEEHHEEAY